MPEVPSYDALYDALETERPLDYSVKADKASYVEGLHKVEGINPADEMLLQIKRAKAGGVWFFTGHRGVGKSTELLRVAHELRQDNRIVVFADMGRYMNLADEISIELLLLTMTYALSLEAERLLGANPLARGYVQRLKDFFTGTKVELSELGLSVGTDAAKAEAKFRLRDDPGLRERVVEAAQASLGAFVTDVRTYVADLLANLNLAHPKRKVVLILDSLEKLRISGTDAEQRYDAIQKTFAVYADHLKFDGISVVYSIPPYLPYLVPGIGSYFGVSVCTLPHVKVFERPTAGAPRDARHQPGVDFMVESLRRRYVACESVIDRSHLEELALASSGSLRDFYRLVRSLRTKAPLAKEPIPMRNSKWTEAVQNDLRSEMPLAREDIVWLKEVRLSFDTGLQKPEDLPKLARMFDNSLILGYRNSREWCDVHYLLRQQVDDAPGAA